MLKRLTLILAGLLLTAAAVSAQTVTGTIGNGTATRGKTAKGTIVFSLPADLHANSNRPGSEYAIPTTVQISAPGAKVSRIIYPRGHNRNFEFSARPINVYEGRTAISFDLTVPAAFKGSTVKVNATVNYQACTNEVCYPPKSKKVTLTAKVI